MSPGVEQSEVKFCGEILERELQFCIRAIDKVKANESSWNYLNGWDSYIKFICIMVPHLSNQFKNCRGLG